MVIVTDSGILNFEPVSSLLIKTLITVFTFLTALSIRDSMTQSIAAVTPHNTTKKLLFTMFVAMFFLFITILLAYFYQDKI